MNTITENRIAAFYLVELSGWTTDRLIKRGNSFGPILLKSGTIFKGKIFTFRFLHSLKYFI
jgi:hypothetical protein